MFKIELYPAFSPKPNKNPNRFYAIPLLGALIKAVAIVPIGIELFLLIAFGLILSLINSFSVLFSGKFWKFCYDFNLKIMSFSTKVILYMTGVTDEYPGFTMAPSGLFSLEIAMPTKPLRWLAFPLLGGIVKLILLIPFSIYYRVINSAGGIALFGSWPKVILQGKYPETTFELVSDSTRLLLASVSYSLGFKDTYPSFKISMNHKNLKIFLIVLGVILSLLSYSSNKTTKTPSQYNFNTGNYYAPK